MKNDIIQQILLANKKTRKIYKSKRRSRMIGRKVFLRRTELKLSQEALAKKINTKQPAIARIENCDLNLQINTLIKITNALKTDLNYLLNIKQVIEYKIQEEYEEKYTIYGDWIIAKRKKPQYDDFPLIQTSLTQDKNINLSEV